MTINEILEVFNKGEKTLSQVAESFGKTEEELTKFINDWMESNKSK